MLFWIREELNAGDARSVCASLWPAKICIEQLTEGPHDNIVQS